MDSSIPETGGLVSYREQYDYLYVEVADHVESVAILLPSGDQLVIDIGGLT